MTIARFWELRRSEDFKLLDQRFLLDDATQLQLLQGLQDSYRKDKAHIDAYAGIDRICYWEEGKYDIEIRVHCARPDKTFSEKRMIELTDEQARQLRLNVVNMLDNPLYTAAGFNPPQHFLVYIPYKVCEPSA